MSTGPFIVKRVQPDTPTRAYTVWSVKAVADLADAHDEALEIVGGLYGDLAYSEAWDNAQEAVLRLGDEGGVVPLPDGSEIHVEATTWDALAKAAGSPGYPAVPYQSVLDAFNGNPVNARLHVGGGSDG